MKPCILLIEDDQDMRDLVAGHLEHTGFDVQKAEDGIKGQALALQYAPDLILLDLMLPKVDGLIPLPPKARYSYLKKWLVRK